MQTRASILLKLWRNGAQPLADFRESASPYMLFALQRAGLVELRCHLTPKGERTALDLLPPEEAKPPQYMGPDRGDMSDIVRW